MNRSDTQENSQPLIGAPDQEKPEAVKARLYQEHKARGTLGTFYDLYPDARPRELPNYKPPRERSRGIER
jgi:hypothetical protein